ncbi:MAG TPA: NADH-quinone oxidoreductase subunit NuoH [Chloroflexi bacterium]|nr:MAG: NADH-quinone oxidoreductase subunit NuoH [Chloroflexota bacterium]HDD55952.1 NADH-quinone oxidoreductase subunit NuoH [Chloroflexota bacterium]
MADLINLIEGWITNLLLGWGASEELTLFLLQALGSVLVVIICFLIVIALIWVERKLAGRIQDRFGPNRAGPFGIFQSFADIIKIFTKEYVTPKGAEKGAFNIAPVLAMASVLAIWAVFPFAINVIGADVHVGVLYIVAVSAFGILAILMAGWSSNNRYALLGASRSVAMLISYEIPMVVSLLVPVLLAHSMKLSVIVKAQQPWWYLLVAPTAALIYLISSMAEIGKAPFDLLEAESELVAGYHTEYSGMKFGMFYVAEFLHQFTVGALITIFFLGGWGGPLAMRWPILGVIYFYGKSFLVYLVISWIRLSLPRIRIDAMLDLNWKFLIPVSFVNLVAVAVADRVMLELDLATWMYVGVMFAVNIFILLASLFLAGKSKPVVEREKFPPRPVAVPPGTES